MPAIGSMPRSSGPDARTNDPTGIVPLAFGVVLSVKGPGCFSSAMPATASAASELTILFACV